METYEEYFLKQVNKAPLDLLINIKTYDRLFSSSILEKLKEKTLETFNQESEREVLNEPWRKKLRRVGCELINKEPEIYLSKPKTLSVYAEITDWLELYQTLCLILDTRLKNLGKPG